MFKVISKNKDKAKEIKEIIEGLGEKCLIQTSEIFQENVQIVDLNTGKTFLSENSVVEFINASKSKVLLKG